MSEPVEYPLTGGCGCGAVRFEVDRPLAVANYCHCTRCQRRTGTAASANARPERGSFRIVAGTEALRAWRPADGWEKWFCSLCGSAVFSRDPHDHDHMSVRMGAFDRDPAIRPSARKFVAYAAPWEPIPDDGLPGTRSRTTTGGGTWRREHQRWLGWRSALPRSRPAGSAHTAGRSAPAGI